jgi:hypothetical protein
MLHQSLLPVSATRSIPALTQHIREGVDVLRFSNICGYQTARTVEVSVQKGKYNALLRDTYCHREKDIEEQP